MRPQDQKLNFYHSNAKSLEDAGLAAPYKVLINEWVIRDRALLAPAEVDPKKSLGN